MIAVPSRFIQVIPSRAELESFFSDIYFRVEIQKKIKLQTDRQLASDFSVFALIDPDENKISDILAMLLNPQGDHGQQELFIRHFFDDILQRKVEPNLLNAKVIRESRTHTIERHRRSIDIFVDTETFALGIENKVDALEQEDQLKHYDEHLRRLRRPDYCLIP